MGDRDTEFTRYAGYVFSIILWYFSLYTCIKYRIFIFAQDPIENQRPVFSSASYQHSPKIIAYRVQILKLKHQNRNTTMYI